MIYDILVIILIIFTLGCMIWFLFLGNKFVDMLNEYSKQIKDINSGGSE